MPMARTRSVLVFLFFHMAGLALCLQNIAFGCTQILVPDPRNTDLICKDIRKYRPNILVNVPTLYQMLLANPMFKTLDFSDVKFALSAAAPLDLGTIKALEEMIGENKVVEAYGMTETSCASHVNPANKDKRKIGSIGIPLPSTEAIIVDIEDHTKIMPLGEEGEIMLRGPQMMQGYWNKPEATKEVMKNGWFYTGDLATVDDEGFIYIVDRQKDMFISGGENVYPAEVEKVLLTNPKIFDVAVYGVSDEKWGEVGKASIMLQDNTEMSVSEVMTFLQGKIGSFKIPKYIDFVDKLPRTATGKIQKHLLVKEFKREIR